MALINSLQSVSPTSDNEMYLPPVKNLSITHDKLFSQDFNHVVDSSRKATESEFSKIHNFSNVFNSSETGTEFKVRKKFSLPNNLRSGLTNTFFSKRK